ncbi:unnamed protein product [Caenorhabditis auriculariae]|uniref:Uncharacterized protein n=1 Tax=Caenorhabditis auriculariae TaxID=2777116 RepID=A0A8S1HRL1_9PELO|nr:unnamed protein product [Caenorhabditis auriculariae]
MSSKALSLPPNYHLYLRDVVQFLEKNEGFKTTTRGSMYQTAIIGGSTLLGGLAGGRNGGLWGALFGAVAGMYLVEDYQGIPQQVMQLSDYEKKQLVEKITKAVCSVKYSDFLDWVVLDNNKFEIASLMIMAVQHVASE